MQQVAQGDEEAFRLIFNTYRPRLYNYMLRLSKSQEAAEDIVQDVFLKIWQGREKLPAVEHFSGFLFQVARNQAYTIFQRRSKEVLILAALKNNDQTTASPNAEEHLAYREVQEFIRQATEKLTPQQKQVFLMSREQGMKHDEIARQLHITTRTVTNHISEALRFLKEEIRNNSYMIILFIVHQLYIR